MCLGSRQHSAPCLTLCTPSRAVAVAQGIEGVEAEGGWVRGTCGSGVGTCFPHQVEMTPVEPAGL